MKIRVEVDGKLEAPPSTIEFYQKDGPRIAQQEIRDGAFQAPTLGASDRFDILLVVAGHQVGFRGLYGSNLKGSWTIGVDQPPFDEVNAEAVPEGLRAKELWFLLLDPLTEESTRIVVAIPSKQ